jgi:hypothetical protein
MKTTITKKKVWCSDIGATVCRLSIAKLAFQLTFDFDWKAWYLIPIVLLQHIYDAIATVLVLLR